MTDTYRPSTGLGTPPVGWHGPAQPQQVPPAQSNGVATGGFVTALVGAVIALIPILGAVSWLICPVGLVLSIIGLGMSANRGGEGRGKGIAGIVLALVGLVVCSMYVAAISNAGNSTPTTTTTSGSGATSYTAPSYSYSAPSYSAPDYSAPSYSEPAAATPTGPLSSVSSGTYEVGTGDGEVAPGKYVAKAGSSSCYYARLKNTDGELGSIIDNKVEVNGGQVLLTVKSSDKALEVSGDCTFTKK